MFFYLQPSFNLFVQYSQSNLPHLRPLCGKAQAETRTWDGRIEWQWHEPLDHRSLSNSRTNVLAHFFFLYDKNIFPVSVNIFTQILETNIFKQNKLF